MKVIGLKLTGLLALGLCVASDDRGAPFLGFLVSGAGGMVG